MSCLGLGHHLAELCGGSDQIALIHLCISEAPAAQPRAVPVTDRVGEVASFLGGRARRDRVTREVAAGRLPGEDLAEPPPIVHGPGQADRLGEVRPGRLGVERPAIRPQAVSARASRAGSSTSRAIDRAC